MHLRKAFVPLAGMVFGANLASAGLIITPIFDSTITNDPNSASIEATIDSAISVFDQTFRNNVDVKIYFQEGGGLGQSDTVSYYDPYYSAVGQSVYKGLVHNDANAAAIAGLNANGGDALTNGGVSPVSGTGGDLDLAVKSANGRALGINNPAACIVTATTPTAANGYVTNVCTAAAGTGAVDGIISLNTGITSPNGTVNTYSLLSTAEHEMDEVLGLGSSLANCDASMIGAPCTDGMAYDSLAYSYATPEDLFRYNASGQRTLSTTCGSPTAAYFSYGSNTGDIAEFNNDCNGGDFGDWQSTPLPVGVNPQVQDAFTGTGVGPTLGTSEIDALTAIGWELATPEPGTMLLFGAGCAALAFYRRRAC